MLLAGLQCRKQQHPQQCNEQRRKTRVEVYTLILPDASTAKLMTQLQSSRYVEFEVAAHFTGHCNCIWALITVWQTMQIESQEQRMNDAACFLHTRNNNTIAVT
jgi:hypothetical protein